MSTTSLIENPPSDPVASDQREDGYTNESLIEEDLLVEEISIDGMCGVY
jgi:mycofactocin precursor